MGTKVLGGDCPFVSLPRRGSGYPSTIHLIHLIHLIPLSFPIATALTMVPYFASSGRTSILSRKPLHRILLPLGRLLLSSYPMPFIHSNVRPVIFQQKGKKRKEKNNQGEERKKKRKDLTLSLSLQSQFENHSPFRGVSLAHKRKSVPSLWIAHRSISLAFG